MSIYASLVCRKCEERLMLGKILWQDDSSKRAFGFWSGSAGTGGHNWQVDDLNHALFSFLAKHYGHSVAVLTDNEIDDQFLDYVPRVPDLDILKFKRADLVELPESAYLTPPDRAKAFSLGHPLVSNRTIVLFTGYYDMLSNPEHAPAIWTYLARWLSEPLVVEITK